MHILVCGQSFIDCRHLRFFRQIEVERIDVDHSGRARLPDILVEHPDVIEIATPTELYLEETFPTWRRAAMCRLKKQANHSLIKVSHIAAAARRTGWIFSFVRACRGTLESLEKSRNGFRQVVQRNHAHGAPQSGKRVCGFHVASGE